MIDWPEDILVRECTSEDLQSIVDIHLEAFPNFFLTGLGPSFLKQYYRSFLGNSEGISICITDEKSNIMGFCVGSIRSNGFHKRLILKNIPGFFKQLVILLLTKPGSLLHLFLNLEKSTEDEPNENISELLSIGIRKSHQGKGIGQLLLSQFEKRIANRGSKCISLTTDFYNNEKVVRFYLQSGYHILRDFITYPNRKMYKMIKIL